MTGWRPALRLAWRDAVRSRGRSILVLVMIALPVLAVTAALVVQRTSDVNGLEGYDRRAGTAAARIWAEPGSGPVAQAADPNDGSAWLGPDAGDDFTQADIAETLGRDVRVVEIRDSQDRARVGERAVDLGITEVDLADPLSDGLFDLASGALPTGPDEVVINSALAAKGVALGDELDVAGSGRTPTVVGIGESTSVRDWPYAFGAPGSLVAADGSSLGRTDWLVETDPVRWDEVLELNARGAFVLSRAVLEDPPRLDQLAEQMGYDTGQGDVIAIIALIAAMVLIEVVLLAGPAFAVGARRQSRTLALIAASGGTPAQARRVILASGVVLGGVAAVLGGVLGLVVGWALLPVVQRFSGSWFGPFEVPWRYVLGVAAFGLVSALLAALVPAWLASRQDVVAVLSGRRGDRPPSAKSPILGVIVLGLGVAGAAYGATAESEGEYFIAISAVVAVLGMILVTPLVVSLVARLSGRMPLPLRYAARDAARHRTRTVPAVAAVAATVAGVVALGIANSSDELERQATYTAQLPMGDGQVTYYADPMLADPTADADEVATKSWLTLERLIRSTVPDVTVERVSGLSENLPDGGYRSYLLSLPGERDDGGLLRSYTTAFGSSMLVDDQLPVAQDALDDEARAAADAALAAGRMVVFTSEPVEADEVKVVTDTWDPATERSERDRLGLVPATFVVFPSDAPAQAIVPPSLARTLGQEPATVGLHLTGADITEDQETQLGETLGGAVRGASAYVERGYQNEDQVVILLLVLGGLGGVLMLGGTLTATFLALSDAKPDLATLAAVGAAPRTRRGVAAAYALVVGSVGALLGAAVGFIPGVAITYPLTGSSADSCTSPSGISGRLTCEASGPYLDIPWLLIVTLVVALPLLTALIVGLTARSRLPLVARLA